MSDSDKVTERGPEVKAFDPELRKRLAAYRDERNVTLGELARELCTNASQLSRYLSGKPVGDVATLETIAEDVLRAARRRSDAAKIELFETSISTQIGARLDLIRETNDVALLSGPAGIGKTCALELYVRSHPASLLITLSRWSGHGSAVAGLIFDGMETRGYGGQLRKIEWIASRLSRSNRLLILDNAHRLTKSGREYVFDLHDRAGLPVALIGNPEILEAIKRSDQEFSRVGMCPELRLKDSAKLCRLISIQSGLSARDYETIADLAERVGGSRGHFRSLRKHLLLLPALVSHCDGDYRQAFLSAHSQLVSDIVLED